MKTNYESFDDVVFENRNKDFGAYELRANYSKRGMLAFAISMAIVFMAIGIPLIANMIKEPVDAVIDIYPTPGEFIDPDEAEKPPIPTLPTPPPSVSSMKFTVPIYVDSISDPAVEFGLLDEFSSNSGTFVDTAAPKIEVIKETKNELDETIVNIIDIEEKPFFSGGDAALLKYIAEHTVYPQHAINTETEGTVYVRFVVTKTGQIGRAEIIRAVDPILDEEALRVIKSLPNWIPGKHNGYPVNVWFIIPVKFKLQY